MKISVAPVGYYWPRETIIEFYREIAKGPADIVYLGEVVCSKRRELKAADWLDIAKELVADGKQVVLSTLTLVEAKSEASVVKRYCEQGDFLVEANEYGAVQRLVEQGASFVGGAALNLYSADAIQELAKLGMTRWIAPVEMSGETIAAITRELIARKVDVATEVYVHGALPLAYSARCFTARRHKLPKDACETICIEYPDGIKVRTQEGDSMTRINGIQTISGEDVDLTPLYAELKAAGVIVARFNPVAQKGSIEAIANFGVSELVQSDAVNGYWYGKPGMDRIPALNI